MSSREKKSLSQRNCEVEWRRVSKQKQTVSKHVTAVMAEGPIARRISARLAGLRFRRGRTNLLKKNVCDYMERSPG